MHFKHFYHLTWAFQIFKMVFRPMFNEFYRSLNLGINSQI